MTQSSDSPQRSTIPDAMSIVFGAVNRSLEREGSFSGADADALGEALAHLERGGPLWQRRTPEDTLRAWAALAEFEVPVRQASRHLGEAHWQLRSDLEVALAGLESRLAWHWPQAMHRCFDLQGCGSPRTAAMGMVAAAFTRAEAMPTMGAYPDQIRAYADVADLTFLEMSHLRTESAGSDGPTRQRCHRRLQQLRAEDRDQWREVLNAYTYHSSGALLRAWFALAPWAADAEDPRAGAARSELVLLEMRLRIRQRGGMARYDALRQGAGGVYGEEGLKRIEAMRRAAPEFTWLDGVRERLTPLVTGRRLSVRARRAAMPVRDVVMDAEHRAMFEEPRLEPPVRTQQPARVSGNSGKVPHCP